MHNDRDRLMTRARAARTFLDSTREDPGLELAAFMSIFHPEVDEATVRKMVEGVRKKDDPPPSNGEAKRDTP